MSEFRLAIARALRRRRAQLGWTRARLAAVAHVSESTVRRHEVGESCSAETVQALADAMRLQLRVET